MNLYVHDVFLSTAFSSSIFYSDMN